MYIVDAESSDREADAVEKDLVDPKRQGRFQTPVSSFKTTGKIKGSDKGAMHRRSMQRGGKGT